MIISSCIFPVSPDTEKLPRGSHLIVAEDLETNSCDPDIPHAWLEWSLWDFAELLDSHGIYLGDQEGVGNLT